MSLNLAETRFLLRLRPGSPMPGLPAVLDLTEGHGPPETMEPRTAPLLLRLRLEQIDTEDPANAISRLAPDGVVLAGGETLAALQAADVALSVIEAESGLPAGGIGIVLEFGALPAALLAGPPLGGASARLCGLILDEDALGAALGLPAESAGTGAAPLALARGHVVLRGADAGVPTFWSVPGALSDPYAVARLGEVIRRDGFAGFVLRDEDQIEALG